MPHDSKGERVQVGDEVLIRATVREVYEGEEYCNVQLETAIPMQPSGAAYQITLNAGQIERVG